MTVSAIALGIYKARMGTGIAGKYIEARLGKPSLVRETSRSVWALRKNWTLFQCFGSEQETDFLSREGIIFNETMSERLNRIATSTKNIKNNQASFQNLLLNGHPGTERPCLQKRWPKTLASTPPSWRVETLHHLEGDLSDDFFFLFVFLLPPWWRFYYYKSKASFTTSLLFVNEME